MSRTLMTTLLLTQESLYFPIGREATVGWLAAQHRCPEALASHAAGAFADPETIARAEALGLDAAAALRANDSTPFFEAWSDLMITGPTGTNVMDVQVVLTPE